MLDKDQLRNKLQDGVEGAKRFNAKPPVWLYFVLFIVIVIGAQLLRHL